MTNLYETILVAGIQVFKDNDGYGPKRVLMHPATFYKSYLDGLPPAERWGMTRDKPTMQGNTPIDVDEKHSVTGFAIVARCPNEHHKLRFLAADENIPVDMVYHRHCPQCQDKGEIIAYCSPDWKE